MKFKKPYCAIFNHFCFKFRIHRSVKEESANEQFKKVSTVHECEIMLDIRDNINIVLYVDK